MSDDSSTTYTQPGAFCFRLTIIVANDPDDIVEVLYVDADSALDAAQRYHDATGTWAGTNCVRQITKIERVGDFLG